MTLHRFEVNIPNPGPQAAEVKLRLEPAAADALAGLCPEKRKPLRIAGATIGRDPCEKGEAELRLTVAPFASIDVFIAVDTGDSPKPGIAGLHLIDRRGGKDVGGVMLVCADPPLQDLPGTIVPAPRPCPIVLAGTPQAIAAGADPASASHLSPALARRDGFDLVAALVNPTEAPLREATAYLEHCGPGGAGFAAGVWNIGTLAPGDIFHASWRVGPGQDSAAVQPVIVVSSARSDPVRLTGRMLIG